MIRQMLNFGKEDQDTYVVGACFAHIQLHLNEMLMLLP